MNWLKTMIYGFISGFTEFLPISSSAHQTIFKNILGFSGANTFLSFVIHLAMLVALCISLRESLHAFLFQLQLSSIPKKRRRRQPDVRVLLEQKLLRTAYYVILPGFFFLPLFRHWSEKLPILSILLILNGFIILIPQFLSQGNKDSRSMRRLDGMLLGIANALSIIPGLSRIGLSTTVSAAQGCSRKSALQWALLLGIPVLFLLCGFDIYDIIRWGTGIDKFKDIVLGITAGLLAFIGSYTGIRLMRFLIQYSDFRIFAFYSWGASLFTFILYLTI